MHAETTKETKNFLIFQANITHKNKAD